MAVCLLLTEFIEAKASQGGRDAASNVAQREGDTNLCSRPAELLCQRHNEETKAVGRAADLEGDERNT